MGNKNEITVSLPINPESEVGPDNQVESTKDFALTPEIQAPCIPPKNSVGPNQPKPWRISVRTKRPQKASDLQPTSRVLKPKINPPSKLKLTGKFIKTCIPSSGRLYEDGRKKIETKDIRRKGKELNRKERWGNPPEKYGQSYGHNSMFFPKEPETYNRATSSSENEKWLQTMWEELKSLNDTNT